MRKLIVASWAVVLALVSSSAFAIDAANSAVNYRTNVTLSGTAPVKLVGAAVGNTRVITVQSGVKGVLVYPSVLTTVSVAVTNDVAALKGCILVPSGSKLVFSPWSEMGGFSGSIFIASVDGTNVVSFAEIGR